MFGNKFWKSLGQKRIQALVGSAVAYSDSPTYEHFLANAVEGEIGFYNNTTKALISGAISSTVEFFAVLKRGGNVFKTTPSLRSDVTASKVAYSAPVNMVTDVAFGTRATLTVGNIVYTARAGGTGGNSITVTVVDPAGNNAALSIGVSGTDITVNLATDGASAPTSTGAQVLAALKASTQASALATFAGTGDMTTVQAAAGQANLAGGAAATAPVAGDIYQIVVMDLSTAAQPFPTYQREYVAKTGDTIQTVITSLASQYNDQTLFVNRDSDQIVTATTGTGILTFTGIDSTVNFRILIREKLEEVAAVVPVNPNKVGSGYYTQVQMLEQAGDIFFGVQTNYPENHATPDEFGKPPSLVLSANTYNMYQWTKFTQESSRTPHNVWSSGKEFFTIAVPSNGTNPSSSIDTILGV